MPHQRVEYFGDFMAMFRIQLNLTKPIENFSIFIFIQLHS